MKEQEILHAYEIAKARYAALGVDTDKAIAALKKIPISLHCWQGDDVNGFEKDAGGTSGGILSTGNYPGHARTPEELRQDLAKVFSLLPGAKRLNLHAIYLDSEKIVDRNEIRPEHFQSWMDFSKANDCPLDFNPTFFGHPKAADNLTLSHPDPAIRQFWIEHANACRDIAEEMGKRQGSPCVMNLWVPDGMKDVTVDRKGARLRLMRSLDTIYANKKDRKYLLDAVESKLFGIGVEHATIGSHEFYMGYAQKNDLLLCLDSGHFHPTEVISDKISSTLLFVKELLLHVSRPVRWDSDHVVLWDDELRAIAQEIVRNGPEKIHIGLDYFDATINRIAAWVIGTRNMQKALLGALLEPAETLRELERNGKNTEKLFLLEELKCFPAAAVYDYYCLQESCPVSLACYEEIANYEKEVLSLRK